MKGSTDVAAILDDVRITPIVIAQLSVMCLTRRATVRWENGHTQRWHQNRIWFS